MNSNSDRLTYIVHPMRESVGKAVIFWVVVVFTIWAVWWNVASVVLTAIAALILLGALTSFYLPTHYSLDAKGAVQERLTGRRRIEWSRVRSVSDEKEGLFLSPFPRKSRLENFRGVYLPYRNNRSEIIEVVRRFVPDVKGLPLPEGDFESAPGEAVTQGRKANVNPFGI